MKKDLDQGAIAGDAAPSGHPGACAMLGEAAKKGTAALGEAWKNDLTKDDRIVLQAAKDRRHRPTAAAADQQSA